MLYKAFETCWTNSINHTFVYEKVRVVKPNQKLFRQYLHYLKLVIENDLEKNNTNTCETLTLGGV